jgi:hypothetical protein
MGRIWDTLTGNYTRLSMIPDSVVSPFAPPSHLNRLITSDLFGSDYTPPVTVEDALSVPAVAKARGILHSLIDNRPLVAYNRAGERLVTQPTWLYRSQSGIPVADRTESMLDDHLFHGETLLWITERGSDNFPINVEHVPFSAWKRDTQGVIQIREQEINNDDLIWIKGPVPGGLLNTGAKKIRESMKLDSAALSRATTQVPMMELHLTDDVEMDADEQEGLYQAALKTFQNPDRPIMITPANVEVRVHGDKHTDMFESGRNAIRIDIANHLNIPANLLDGGVDNKTIAYSNEQGKRNELYDMTLQFWTKGIEGYLSQDRATPRGTSIRFDFSDLFAPTQTGSPVTED